MELTFRLTVGSSSEEDVSHEFYYETYDSDHDYAESHELEIERELRSIALLGEPENRFNRF